MKNEVVKKMEEFQHKVEKIIQERNNELKRETQRERERAKPSGTENAGS